ncbi:hypothetical protein A15D_03190 [Alcanivorax sp. MD8A]|uniref:CSLREA domain-containing protein n=1 Tax=Alcanivorax sp. MD8A TaxID=1177157 RepID=UPI000C9C8FCA|nr:CSLREA domain-containing protein [Alcanivorax sp. MD8A]PNE01231.1 hypothetical protein A15D_03190 [Alcanivorax sp. MD8A]
MFRYFVACIVCSVACLVQAQTFYVNSSGDDNDPVDELLTLREALANANAVTGPDTIFLPAGIQIGTSQGYFITDDVEIIGVQGEEAVLTSAAEVLFEIDSDINVGLRNLSLGVVNDPSLGFSMGVRACGEVSMYNLRASGFSNAIRLCSSRVELNTGNSVFSDNGNFLFASGSVAPISVSVENSYIENSGLHLRGYGEEQEIALRRSVFVAEDKVISLYGRGTIKVIDSALLLSKQHLFLAMWDTAYSTYHYPNIEIIQSTVAGHNSVYPIMVTEGANVKIAHSTWVDNVNSDGPLLDIKTYKPRNSSEYHGSIEIDHTIFDRYFTEGMPISLYGVDLAASYSFLPSVERRFGSENVSMDSTTALYQGAPAYLGELSFSLGHLPYYLASADSPVIDAGRPSAIAGEDGVPASEQRQSVRILGAAIDIGSTERNQEPTLDVQALREEYEAQVADLEDPDADIVLDLDSFVSDPDGHIITDIEFYSPADLSYESDTHVLSGHKAAFKVALMQALIHEETGLTGLAEADWSPQPEGAIVSGGGGDSGGGGGSLPLATGLLLMFIGMHRRRSR